MTKEEVAELVEKVLPGLAPESFLIALANEAEKMEREECAKLADQVNSDLANKIRARGQK